MTFPGTRRAEHEAMLQAREQREADRPGAVLSENDSCWIGTRGFWLLDNGRYFGFDAAECREACAQVRADVVAQFDDAHARFRILITRSMLSVSNPSALSWWRRACRASSISSPSPSASIS